MDDKWTVERGDDGPWMLCRYGSGRLLARGSYDACEALDLAEKSLDQMGYPRARMSWRLMRDLPADTTGFALVLSP